jgi:hypothetical protein
VAVDAVGPADPEAEVEQPLLQGEDVVTAGQAAGNVGEQPVTEPPAGFVEDPVGERADDAVDGQPTLLLEGAHRPVEVGVEGVTRHARVGGGRLVVPVEGGQQRADLGDGRAGVAEP